MPPVPNVIAVDIAPASYHSQETCLPPPHPTHQQAGNSALCQATGCLPSGRQRLVDRQAPHATVVSGPRDAGFQKSEPITNTVRLPENAPVLVSAGDDEWHPAYWADNTRAIQIWRNNLTPGGPVTFIRRADLALKDVRGNPMYLAANRARPAFVRLVDTDTPLYIATPLGGFSRATLEALRRKALEIATSRKRDE